jgi:hypothetical protein
MPRVFLSFRMADMPSRDALVRSLRGGPVEIEDYPVESPYDLGWRAICEKMITEADGVIVLVGSTTAGSESVRWEIAKARELGKPILGVRIGTAAHDLPEGLSDGRVLDWHLGRIGKELESWSSAAPPQPRRSVTVT